MGSKHVSDDPVIVQSKELDVSGTDYLVELHSYIFLRLVHGFSILFEISFVQ